jgi:methyl-accepting chemotaxis protein
MNWFINLNIKDKLMSGFTFIAVIAAVIGAIGIKNIRELDDSDTELYSTLVQVESIGDASTNFQRMRVDIANMVNAETPDETQLWKKNLLERRADITKFVVDFENAPMSEQEKIGIADLKAQRKIFIPLVDRMASLCETGKRSEAKLLWKGEAESARANFQNALAKLVSMQVGEGKGRSDDNTNLAASATKQMIAFIVVGFALAIGFGLLISRIITKPLAQGVAMMDELSKAHLGVRLNLDRTDEIGVLVHRMDSFAEVLQAMVTNIYTIADGDLNVEIKNLDDKDEIAPAMISIVEALRDLVAESTMLTTAAVDGRLGVRGRSERFKGGYREIVDGVNRTLDAVILPVKEGSDVLAVMAKGDLRVRLTGEYKGDHQLIKNSINLLGESLDKTLNDVSEALFATASASSEISSSTEQMAAGAHEQTQQASEVASAVEQMSKTIMETTKNASEAANMAKQSGSSAKDGGRVVIETIEGMARIAEVVKQSAATVEALGSSSDEIGEIIQVIDDIADQTNLLALNAAIEAARAGEHGRGFAVVADEVRKLAERTTKATKEIAVMIKQIQKDTAGAVASMNRGTAEVEKGRKLAEQSGVSLKEIIEGAEKVVDVVTQVAAASEQQSTASEQISKNIEAISCVSQQSAAGTQQIARAAEDLNRLTSNLQTLLGQFSISGAQTGAHRREERGLTMVRSNGRYLN